MSDKTKIEWTDATWNPITGCSIVSSGCKNCYAMKLAGTRLQHHPSRAGLTAETKTGPVWNGQVRFNQEWLDQPLKWRKPRMIFVCAHGDLFHENIPDEWIARVFAVMRSAPQHTFQVLTKRPERMWSWLNQCAQWDGWITHNGQPVEKAYNGDGIIVADANNWPLKNVWLGVSVEDQKQVAKRIKPLLMSPASVRFISAEPLLSEINLKHIQTYSYASSEDVLNAFTGIMQSYRHDGGGMSELPGKIHWVIAGGESGDNARPMNPRWARDLRDQCQTSGIAFFFKQWGNWVEYAGRGQADYKRNPIVDVGGTPMMRVAKKEAGRLLDGREWNEIPERWAA